MTLQELAAAALAERERQEEETRIERQRQEAEAERQRRDALAAQTIERLHKISPDIEITILDDGTVQADGLHFALIQNRHGHYLAVETPCFHETCPNLAWTGFTGLAGLGQALAYRQTRAMCEQHNPF